jgi:tRNA(Ile)-lysidine synthase
VTTLKVPGKTVVPAVRSSVHATLLTGRNADKVVRDLLTRKHSPGRTDLTPKGAHDSARARGRTGEDLLPASARKARPRVEHLDADRLVFPLVVRTWRAGDRFRPLGQSSSKKLQDCFVDRKVPREERSRLPLVCSGDEIVWVAGLGISDGVRLTDKTSRVLRLRCTIQ